MNMRILNMRSMKVMMSRYTWVIMTMSLTVKITATIMTNKMIMTLMNMVTIMKIPTIMTIMVIMMNKTTTCTLITMMTS